MRAAFPEGLHHCLDEEVLKTEKSQLMAIIPEVTGDDLSDIPVQPPSLGTNDGVDSTEESHNDTFQAATSATPETNANPDHEGDSQENERVQAAKLNALTIREATILSKYLQGQATVARAAPRCEECSPSCFGCIKTGRMSTGDEVTLQKMEHNLEENS